MTEDKRLNEKRFFTGDKYYVFFQKEEGGPVYYQQSFDNKAWTLPVIVPSVRCRRSK